MTLRVDGSTEDHAADEPTPARVTLVISGLVVGGAERVLTALANGWAEAGRHVSIVTLDGPGEPPYFPVDPRVGVRRLGLAGVSRHRLAAVANNLRRLRGMRRAIADTRPDVVVSFMDRTNVLTLLATFGESWPVIVSDRTAADPTTGRIWQLLRSVTYRRAYRVVVQTVGSARAMPEHLSRRTVTIPNPVLLDPLNDLPAGSDTGPSGRQVADPSLIVALGRLVPQKGFDFLIDAFASVAPRAPEARLEIWGAGPEEGALRALVARRGLDARVRLAGPTRDPGSAIGRAGLFVVSSRVEGFPNVLLEAMAMGKPVVAIDCEYGPAEIVRDGIDGRLIPAGDGRALADSILELLANPEQAAAFGQRAIEVRDRFALAIILASWTDLVESARGQTRR